jgi:DMSO/TMAO reductase YedYZ molybdopterin-dependent catalytic subunit
MKVWALLLVLAAAPALAQERPSPVTTRVTIAGEVQRELVLAIEDLREIGRRRGVVEGRGYAGVKLTDVLEEADIRRDAHRALRRTYVVAIASDGFQAVFSWGELFNTAVGGGVLVAFARDGALLRDGEGRIALVSLADERPGQRHVKWLSRIEVRRIPEL